MQPEIQWFIARDGKQHGPISDVEMTKLVELGHLRQGDLVWRQGFPDWRPAQSVFPPAAPSPAAPAPVPLQPVQPIASGPAQPAQTPRQDSPAARPVQSQAPQDRLVEPRAAAPAAAARPAQAGWPAEVASAPRSSLRKLVIAGLLVILLPGTAWLIYTYRDSFKALKSSRVTPASVKVDADSKSAAPSTAPATPAAADVALDPAAANLDPSFQKFQHWVVIKREFPDWYGERLKEASKLTAESKSSGEVAKYLAGEIVKLRRKHAQDALSASADRLKSLAGSFLSNLEALRKIGPMECFHFIARGESTPIIAEMLQSPVSTVPLQAQVASTFEAIGEGRKSPVKHAAPQKSDYDLLAAELGTLGWGPSDMQLFSNPKALSAAEPQQVCKMVQDWFKAHLLLKDAAVQERLLGETLKPVVGG